MSTQGTSLSQNQAFGPMKTLSLRSLFLNLPIVLCLLVSCSRSEFQTKSSETPLRIGSLHTLQAIDPAFAKDELSIQVSSLLFETLYQLNYHSQPLQTIPLLAMDLPKFSSDFKDVTIYIRDDVYFHSPSAAGSASEGQRKLQATDFINSFKRLAALESHQEAWWNLLIYIKGMRAFQKTLLDSKDAKTYIENFYKPIEGLSASDTYRLEFHFEKPMPQAAELLTLNATAPLAFGTLQPPFDRSLPVPYSRLIGTGPFSVFEWEPTKKLTLKRHPLYHAEFYPKEISKSLLNSGNVKAAGRGLPRFATLELFELQNFKTLWNAFVQNHLDSIYLPLPQLQEGQEAAKKLNSAEVRVKPSAESIFYFLSFNNKDPLIGKNTALRKAIHFALNRERLIEILGNGNAKAAGSFLPDAYFKNLTSSAPKQDLNLAKEWMQKAGFKKELELRVHFFENNPLIKKAGAELTSQLSKIKIKTLCTYQAEREADGQNRKENPSAASIEFRGWSLDYPSATNVFFMLYGPNRSPGPNRANYQNLEFDSLFETLLHTPTASQDKGLLQKMETILENDLPWIPVFFSRRMEITHAWVENPRANPIIPNRWKYWWIDGSEQEIAH